MSFTDHTFAANHSNLLDPNENYGDTPAESVDFYTRHVEWKPLTELYKENERTLLPKSGKIQPGTL